MESNIADLDSYMRARLHDDKVEPQVLIRWLKVRNVQTTRSSTKYLNVCPFIILSYFQQILPQCFQATIPAIHRSNPKFISALVRHVCEKTVTGTSYYIMA